TLQYRAVTDPLFEFKDPPPIEHEEAAFRLRLEDGKLRVEMKNHHATTESAREVVEPLLGDRRGAQPGTPRDVVRVRPARAHRPEPATPWRHRSTRDVQRQDQRRSPREDHFA